MSVKRQATWMDSPVIYLAFIHSFHLFIFHITNWPSTVNSHFPIRHVHFVCLSSLVVSCSSSFSFSLIWLLVRLSMRLALAWALVARWPLHTTNNTCLRLMQCALSSPLVCTLMNWFFLSLSLLNVDPCLEYLFTAMRSACNCISNPTDSTVTFALLSPLCPGVLLFHRSTPDYTHPVQLCARW